MSLFAALLLLTPTGDAVVSVELLAPRTVAPTMSQKWARRFAEEDVRVTVRPARPGEDLGIFEKVRGPLRFVTVRAELAKTGEIELPDRTLRLGDGASFSEWVDGLKVYGAAGDPAGKPDWGLSPVDWDLLCRDAAKRGPALENATVGAVMDRLESVTGRPVQGGDTIDREAACQSPPAELSVGVGTAIALRSDVIGLYPVRTPEGTISWSVKALDDEKTAWPTGWAMTPDADRGRAMGALYQNGELPRAAKLGDYVDRMEAATDVPHVPLRRDLAEWRREWRSVDTSLQPNKGRPLLVLNRILRKNRLTTRTVWDDAGRAFLLIRPSDGKPDPKPRTLRPPRVRALDPVRGE